jgi:microcystin-dependent protein
MTDYFLGEIRVFPFAFPPKGWALCNGQFLSINQNQALFSLLGTTYGGNGQTTFQLPNLQGRVPIHAGRSHTLGEAAGEVSHTLVQAEMPNHTHALSASGLNGDTAVPTSNVLGSASGLYGPPGSLVTLEPSTLASVGGSQPHQNMQPFLTLSFCISLVGIFPSRD